METVYFDIEQSKAELPIGDYEMLARMKAEAADTAKMEVLNLNDTDEWASIYSPGAVNIICLKIYKDKLYAGTSDGKIYVTEDGENFSLGYDTGEAEVHCFKEYEDYLYVGTGNSGKIFKYDEAAWTEDYDTGETDVFCLKEFYASLHAGTGTNGKLFRLKGGSWAEYMDLTESSIFTLESHSDNLYAGTGADGKIERLLFGDYTPILATYSSVGASYTRGLTWDGSRIWSCDSSTKKIYKHNADMTVDTEYTPSGVVGGYVPYGLAWDGTNIWSCDYANNKIYKHDVADPNLAVLNTYNGLGSLPTGLTWDGSRIWSCDTGTNKIYKHAVDMSLDTAYASPHANPHGLAWDGEYIWSCDRWTKIYKHNADMSVDYTYHAYIPGTYTNIYGLTWDGNHIWSCKGGILNSIFKYKTIGMVYDATDTDIYTLKSLAGTLYAGGDGGNIYKTSDGDSWSTDYATGEAEIRGLFELGGLLYAGTGSNGKLFVLDSTWALSEDLEDITIYAGETFNNRNFIGTGASGNIYIYRNGILAGEQKTLTTAYALYKLPFTITSLDADNTIRFRITNDGAIADWVNVDFFCFVAI